MRVFQIQYDSNTSYRGIKFDSYLLESSRVCVGSYANFHVFYYLVYGTPEVLRTNLGLDTNCFSVSSRLTNYATSVVPE